MNSILRSGSTFSLLFFFLFFLLNDPRSEASFCGDLMTNMGNRLNKALGLLPSTIRIVGAPSRGIDHLHWNTFLSNGFENGHIEIYDKYGHLLSSSEIFTSNKFHKIMVIDVLTHMADSLQKAHLKTMDSSSWCIRLVHNHPSSSIGGFSGGDISVAFTIKQIIEFMGYEDASFSMDLLVNRNSVHTFLVPPEISLKNKSYAPSDIALNDRDLEIVSRTRQIYTKESLVHHENDLLIKNALENEFKIQTVHEKVPEYYTILSRLAETTKVDRMAVYSSKNLDLSEGLFVDFSPNLTDEKNSLDFFFKEPIFNLILKINQSPVKDESIHFFFSKKVSSLEETDRIIKMAIRMRGVLDKIEGSKNLIFDYMTDTGVLKRMTLEFEFKVSPISTLNEK